MITLKGRITADGKIELLDPLQESAEENQEVRILLGDDERLFVYESVDDYGNRVVIDEINGTVTPEHIITIGEILSSEIVGMWADRKDEIGDPVAWLKAQREKDWGRRNPWRGQKP